MSASAIVMMVLICGVVWGGFVFFLARAMRSEGKKKSSARTAG
jgi:heme/copper-type cytochrome/quinol oxidase subunit 2